VVINLTEENCFELKKTTIKATETKEGGLMASFMTFKQANEKVNKEGQGIVPGQYQKGITFGLGKLDNEMGV